MLEAVRLGARSGLVTVLFGFVACGISERHVDELTDIDELSDTGGASSGTAHAGQAHGGFASGGGGGVAGTFGVPAGGAFNGSGGKAFGGMPLGGMAPVGVCPDVPPFEPSCSPEASAGQGGAGGDTAGWCSAATTEGGAPADDNAAMGGAAVDGDGAGGESGGGLVTGGAPSMPDPTSGLLIDDFEDGDGTSFPVLGGQGLWFVVNDGSGLQFPAPCTLPSLLSEPERGSRRAMRTYGQGFISQPGGYSLIGLSVRSGAPACDQSIDASAFDGVEFWARGSGTVRFFIGTVATHPLIDAGSCPANCYDAHGNSVTLGATWQRYRMRFDQLLQEGWGYPAGFDRSKILGLHWSAKVAPFDPTPSACFDFWIDDVAFYAD